MAKKSNIVHNEEDKKPDEFGPQYADRKCRDVFFLILFALFWVGMVVISALAYANGDPRRMM